MMLRLPSAQAFGSVQVRKLSLRIPPRRRSIDQRRPLMRTQRAHAAPRLQLAASTCRATRSSVNAQQQSVNAPQGLEIGDVEEIRNVVASTLQYSVKGQRVKETGHPVTDFVAKVHLAWRIFFPEKQKIVSPKEEVKKRLRMVLVADRCGMSPASLSEMKKTIVKALQEFVDIEAEDAIEVAISTEPELGTVYSVNIPIRRVKPDARFGASGFPEGQVADGITLQWDPADWNSDPSSRFPMGC